MSCPRTDRQEQRGTLFRSISVLTIFTAVVAAAASIWATSQIVSATVTEAHARSTRADQVVSTELMSYAEHHATWSGVAALLPRFERQTGNEFQFLSDGRVVASTKGFIEGDPTQSHLRIDAQSESRVPPTRCSLDPACSGIPAVTGAPPLDVWVQTPAPVAAIGWKPVGAGQLRAGVILAVVLLLILASSLVFARRIASPLHGISVAARRARGGDLLARAPALRRRDEVGQLSADFNAMAEARERAELSRTQLVNDVSHELRTPIANVLAWVEAAEDGLADLDQELLTTLHAQATALQHLTDDLHELALGDADRLDLHFEHCSASQLLTQAARGAAAAADRAGVSIFVKASEGLEVAADPRRLEQVFANLLSNALRHTPRGGQIYLVARANKNDIVFDIRDTGIGIALADQEHVFDRFYRADRSRNRRTGGSGLGLAIARRLVTAQGGTVTVESEVGRGSTFRVCLPKVIPAPPSGAKH